MDIDATKRTIGSLIIAAVVVVILYFTVSPVRIMPRGIVLPTGEKSSTAKIVPSGVNLFTTETSPLTYQTVGYINIEYHAPQGTSTVETTLYQYAKILAARAGGNGIIIDLFGHTVSSQVPASQSFYVLRGLVIFSSVGE